MFGYRENTFQRGGKCDFQIYQNPGGKRIEENRDQRSLHLARDIGHNRATVLVLVLQFLRLVVLIRKDVHLSPNLTPIPSPKDHPMADMNFPSFFFLTPQNFQILTLPLFVLLVCWIACVSGVFVSGCDCECGASGVLRYVA